MEEEDHELYFMDPKMKRRKTAVSCGVCSLVLLSVVLGALAAALAITLGIVLSRSDDCPAAPSPQPKNVTCTKESCVELSQMVRSALNTSVDPCKDFYKFSCGGWESSHSLPPGYGSFSQFRKLDQENGKKLILALTGETDSDIEGVSKAKSLYQSCMDTERIEELGAEPLINITEFFGGWNLIGTEPSYDEGDIDLFSFMKLAGNTAFFSFWVGVDDKNSSQYTLFLEQDGLSLPSPESYDNSTLVSALKTYIAAVLYLVNPGGDNTTFADAAERIVQLEANLSSILVPAVELRDPEATYNPMTIGDLSVNFSGTFNWTELFENISTVLDPDWNITLNEDTEIVVRTPSYFENLSSIMDSFDNDTLYDYTMWHTIKHLISLLSSDFLQVHYNFTEIITGNGKKARNLTCLSLVQSSFPMALARLYTVLYFPSNAKSSVVTIIDEVKKSFKERIMSKKWIDNETKDKCEKKVDAITQRVAYPEQIYNDYYIDSLYETYDVDVLQFASTLVRITFYASLKNLLKLDTPVDKTEWDIAPTAVNAYYNPSFNQFTFLEGILAPPFLDADWPYYFQYGAFGVVVGHELTHGFDDQGQQYDKDGNLEQWWSNYSLEKFKERQSCFRKQYSGYEVFNTSVNGNLTLGENLADNGGLKTSYQAYHDLVGNHTQPHLPSLNYTPDQLFFIAFSQVWCSLYTPEYITTLTQTNPHSPGPIRVIGTLSNSQEFSDAFKCDKTSPMNPPDKCLMW